MEYIRKENSLTIAKDDVTYYANRTDPFGLWTVTKKVGKKYTKWDEQFTSVEDARKKIEKELQTSPTVNAA